MIELALVLILLVMLLVGTVTAAVAFGRGNSIQNAAREASRYAATRDEVASNLNEVIQVAKAASSGDLDPSAPGYYVCVAYVNGVANVRATEGSPPTLPGDNTCYADGRPATETRVQVTAGRDTTINAIVFSTDVPLTTEAAARYER
jgi:Flp pilus assembly protein TadG